MKSRVLSVAAVTIVAALTCPKLAHAEGAPTQAAAATPPPESATPAVAPPASTAPPSGDPAAAPGGPGAPASDPSAPAAAPSTPPAPADTTEDTGSENQKGPHDPKATMQMQGSVFGMLGYGYGFAAGYGVGARFQFVVANDVVKSLKFHDEFGIEVGLDYLVASYDDNLPGYDYSWTYKELTPVVGVTWNVWLNDHLAVYPKVDLGYHIVSWDGSLNGASIDTGHASISALYFQAAAGVVARVAGPLTLRAEVGWRALRAGVGFSFI